MTEFLTWWHSPTTLVFLIGSAGMLVFWRLTNSQINFSFDAKTSEPEPSEAQRAELKAQIEIAKREAGKKP